LPASIGTNAGGTGPNTFPNRTTGNSGTRPVGSGTVGNPTPGTTGPAIGQGQGVDRTAKTSSANPAVNDKLSSGPLGLSVAEVKGEGLSVTTTIQGGVAQQAGIVLADQLLSNNGRMLRTGSDLASAVKQAAESGKPATIGLRRGGENHVIHVDLSKPAPTLGPPSTGTRPSSTGAPRATPMKALGAPAL